MGLKSHYEFYFNGDIQDLIKQIQLIEDPNIEPLGGYEYFLRAQSSIGVAISNGIPIFDSIKVFAKISLVSKTRQRIELIRKPRKELYLIILLSILLFVVSVFQDFELYVPLIFLFVGIFLPLLFNFIFWIQEKAVVDRFVGQLGLKEK